MSVATEITRLQNAKTAIKNAIQNKGVTVPSSTKLDGYASLIASISGGGANIGTASVTNSSNTATSLSFTVSGSPKAFFLRCTTQISSSGSTTYYYIINMVYDGSTTEGTFFRIGSTRRVQSDSSHYSFAYSSGTLTVQSSGSRTATGGSFYNGTYELVYVY